MFPRVTSSIESQMTSRLTREARIPSVPIVMPSLIETVLNSSGVPPPRESLPYLRRQLAQMEVARPDLNPGIRHSNQRLLEIVIF